MVESWESKSKAASAFQHNADDNTKSQFTGTTGYFTGI